MNQNHNVQCCSECSNTSYIDRNRELIGELNEQERNKGVKNIKSEGKLRIIFYGENIMELLIKENSIIDNKIIDGETNFYHRYYNALNWDCYFCDKINEENNKKISKKIEEDYLMSDFFDIIVISVNYLLDENSKMFFSHFEKYTNQMIKQPFILFLTKKEDNPKVEQLYPFITNQYFDKRTIYALKFPKSEEDDDLKKVLELICRFRNYYHEEGDIFETFDEEISTNYKFNILLCGRAGTGKSSFINQFIGSKKAKEGEGLSVTNKIVTYTHPVYPINISDTPGFEDEKTVQKVKMLLNKYNEKLLNAKKKINLIIYMVPYAERSILSLEVPLLESLLKYNTEILFVINFVKDPINKKHYKRIESIFRDSLEKLLPEDFKIKIYPINLYNQTNDDDENNIKVIKPFGLDILFKDIYHLYEGNIIDLKVIRNIKNYDQLFQLLRKNTLYNHFISVNDMFISFRSELANIILSYGRLSRLSFNKEKFMKNMVDVIYEKCTGKKCDKFQEYMEYLSFPNKVEYYFNDFTEKLAILKSYDKQIHTIFFYESIHDHKTLALGYLCMQDIEKIYESSPNIFLENDKLNKDLVYNLCDSYNKAIKGFEYIGKHFEEIYKKDENIIIINKEIEEKKPLDNNNNTEEKKDNININIIEDNKHLDNNSNGEKEENTKLINKKEEGKPLVNINVGQNETNINIIEHCEETKPLKNVNNTEKVEKMKIDSEFENNNIEKENLEKKNVFVVDINNTNEVKKEKND